MSQRIERPGRHTFTALQMSLAVHLAVLLILIGTGSSLKPADRLLVVDFRMEDSPNNGDRTFAASEVKFHRDIGQKAGTTKQTQRKQKDQDSTNPVPIQEMTVHATSEIIGTSVSEKPQVISPINPDAKPADTVQSFATFGISDTIFPGTIGPLDGSTGVKGVIKSGEIADGGASGGQNGPARGEYLRKNFSYIRDMIQKKIIYPALAKRMGWEGKVTVSFIVVSDGRVRNIEVKEGSGRDILDKNAVETIRITSPFPAPPTEAQIIIPIYYKLI